MITKTLENLHTKDVIQPSYLALLNQGHICKWQETDIGVLDLSVPEEKLLQDKMWSFICPLGWQI